MKRWIKKFERAFVAIAFAEAGEHHIAMEMSGIRPWKKKDCLTLWDKIFMAVTFAEAGQRVHFSYEPSGSGFSAEPSWEAMGVNLLIIEKECFLYEHLYGRLGTKDYRIFQPRQLAETKRILKRRNIDVVLLDLNGLKREGLALLKVIKKMRPAVQVIIINNAEQISLSIEGMRLGAFDDLFIPLDLDMLITRITEAFEQKKKAEVRKPSFFQRCQDLMVAASFAEAGEDDMAREILNCGSDHKSCIKDKQIKEPNKGEKK